jgi:uncharacterized protein with FMN-binding domain
VIRTTAVPRPLRTGAALLGVTGIALLAGCSGGSTADTSAEPGTAASEPPAADSGSTDGGSSDGGSTGAYADGTYEAEGSYQTPETTETIQVSLTLEDSVVTAVEVTGDPQAPQSQQYQSRFIGGIADEVVGRNVDEISVSRVAGSSLTSGGFNAALETIKADAAAS